MGRIEGQQHFMSRSSPSVCSPRLYLACPQCGVSKYPHKGWCSNPPFMRLPDPAELAAFEQFYDELLTPSMSKDDAYAVWLKDRENASGQVTASEEHRNHDR